jgi:Zn-dependent M28 family amino/carboxypeptidase
MNIYKVKLILLSIMVLVACQEPAPETTSVARIDELGIAAHIETLASDEFQGRMPNTIGEQLTVEYITNTFKELGVAPGNGDSYTQQVPLVEIESTPKGPMTIKSTAGSTELTYLDQFVALSRRVEPEVMVEDSELVFAGYGIVAPEYDWDDYQDLDVSGKTVVVLVNDPGYGTTDSTFFKGNTMTYYGRWTYKYEEAARQGAAGVIIVHSDGPAGYPWEVVRGGWSGPSQYLKAADNNASRCAVEGWITYEVAQKLFQDAGLEAELMQEAAQAGFKAVDLKATMSVALSNRTEETVSDNVIGVIPGSERPEEVIIYSAHWDHMGVGEAIDGDSIYNGAEDNASGVACLLEIAEEFMNAETPPKRSIAILLITAEEQGLLGSAYYAANPIFEPAKTIANLNIDALGSYGATNDLIIIGYGQSELDDYATEVAQQQGRYIVPDQEPEKGYFFRSDHFNFAKIGIPALYAEGGLDSKKHGKEWGTARKQEYTANRYHKPFDEYDPANWDLSGMVQDAQLFYEIGYTLSQESSYPQWKPGSEFKAIREADQP